YEQQAGVDDDTQLRQSVEHEFLDLRDILNPLEGLDAKVAGLIAQVAAQDQTLAQLPVLPVTPAPEPLAQLQSALQAALAPYQQKKDIDTLTSSVLTAVLRFETDRDNYNHQIDDILRALDIYQQATAPTPVTPPAVVGGAASGAALGDVLAGATGAVG